MKLIDKSAVVAEIERKLKNIDLNYVCAGSHPSDFDTNKRLQNGISKNLQSLLSFLDTLEVKELLTWQDIRLISEIGEDFMNSQESDTLNEEEYYTEILNRFKAQKGK